MPLIDLNGLGHFKDKENEMIAADYSATKTYAVGDYVFYNGVLYRCTTAITAAEAWTSGHWASAQLAVDVFGANNAISAEETAQVNAYNRTNALDYSKITSGQRMKVADGSVVTSNTASLSDYIPVMYGMELTVNYKMSSNTYGDAFYDRNFGLIETKTSASAPRTYIVPENAFYFRSTIPNTAIVSGEETATVILSPLKKVYNFAPNMDIENGSFTSSGAPSSTNADKRLRSKYLPVNPKLGFSVKVPTNFKVNYFTYSAKDYTTFVAQSDAFTEDFTVTTLTATEKYVRLWIREVDNATITPSDVPDLASIFRYNNDMVLLPSETGADQTADIEWLLATGCCKLSSGSFYTTGISMSDNSSLIGSGADTVLVLSGNNDGSCITLGRRCTVKNMTIMGSADDLVLSSTIGDRHGIYLEGSGSSDTPYKGVISDCFFSGFTGGGVTLYNTGYSSSGGIAINNCNFTNCCVGLYIKSLSEYHKINNCTFASNYYGCINNGGNNQFTCCSFVSNQYGFMMGDTEGTSYSNSAHGCAVGCNFGHNTIRAIYMNTMSSGFIYTGCNISENGAEIIKSSDVIFTACAMLSSFSLTVNKGGVILFNSCTFRDTFTGAAVSITDNTTTFFSDCYYRDGTVCDPTA